MVAVIERKPETHDEAVCRLARVAEERGVRVYDYTTPQGELEFYATSISRPDTLHRVTRLSCDCPGFCRHQRCSHHSALLDSLGELPRIDPDPEPPANGAMPVNLIAAAQAEVDQRFHSARSLADFRNLQAARAMLAELIAGVDPAVEDQRFAAMMAAA